MVAMLIQALKRCPGHSVGAGGLVMHERPEVLELHTEHCIPFEPAHDSVGVPLLNLRILLTKSSEHVLCPFVPNFSVIG